MDKNNSGTEKFLKKVEEITEKTKELGYNSSERVELIKIFFSRQILGPI